ncbi:MAG TPA: hypothetical protein VFN64_04835, partial [Burkholderiaceae bacterium]|nr:hypothetical protein [Burkholderiaceae bacterium]
PHGARQGAALMADGWTWLWNARKWHYFVGGRSLCGRWLLLATADCRDYAEPSPDDCRACRRKLKEQRP